MSQYHYSMPCSRRTAPAGRATTAPTTIILIAEAAEIEVLKIEERCICESWLPLNLFTPYFARFSTRSGLMLPRHCHAGHRLRPKRDDRPFSDLNVLHLLVLRRLLLQNIVYISRLTRRSSALLPHILFYHPSGL